jgi:hypothetical protein
LLGRNANPVGSGEQDSTENAVPVLAERLLSRRPSGICAGLLLMEDLDEDMGDVGIDLLNGDSVQ